MPRYKVTLNELASYEVGVDAENEDEAKEAAEECFRQSENIAEFPCTVHAREVEHVERFEEES